ncbi:MAG: BamA/TamA family outer membrane protein [Longimicrobiales bacterium]
MKSLERSAWVLTVLALATSAGLLPLRGQECPAGRIATIQVESQDVFDLDDFQEGSFLRGVFRVANVIHINTSESYIRSELLFKEGDCYDPFLLEESVRILRSRIFIKWAEVAEERQGDGDVAVRLRVQDDWTLKLGLGLSFDEGLRLEELLLQENNLLGQGLTVAVARVQAREVLENYFNFAAARLFGTAWTFDGTAGKTRQGPFVEESLSFPFSSEVSRLAFTQAFSFREDYFPYSTSGIENPTHVLLPFRREFAQVTVARRLGRPGDLWVLGGGLSRESLSFPEGPEGLRVVMDEVFRDLLPATDAEVEAVQGQSTPLSATRLNLFAGFRNVDYVLREGLDAVLAPQDVQVGSEMTVALNPSLRFLGRKRDAEDVHGRVDLFWAFAPEPWVVSLRAKGEGRYVRNAGEDPEGWRDVLSEVDLKLYVKPRWLEKHTLFSRISAARSWSMDRPFQLTLGGRDGVRGYSQDAFPGGRRFLASLEDRFPLVQSGVADAGLAIFGDLGRVWGQDVPYGTDSGWRSSVGVGVRANLPGGALRTVRADFTYPLSGDRDLHAVYFRFYAEIGGLLQSSKRPGQVERSRFSGIDTDLTVSRPSG